MYYIISLFLVSQPSITWSFNSGGNVLSSPAIADVNDTLSGSEVIFAKCSPSGAVYCLSSTGTLLWSRDFEGMIHTSPIIADLGTGGPAIVIGTNYSDSNGIYCLNNDGSIRWFFLTGAHHCCSAPIIANIDTIGSPEIIFGCTDSYLRCLDSNGNLVWSFSCSESIDGEAPLVANIDMTGTPEVIVNSDIRLYCLNSDGSLRWSVYFPQNVGSYGRANGVSPSIADVDLDGDPEIIVGGICYEHTGTLRWYYPLPAYSTSAVADLDYDNIPEIVTYGKNDTLYALKDESGVPVLLWQAQAIDVTKTFPTPIICDIMGDSALDVIWVGTSSLRIYDGKTGAVLYEDTSLYSSTCSEHGAVSADIDNDGIIEIVAIYRENGVALLEDDSDWARCDKNRFSGHLYHITGINTDLSVPNSEPYSWQIHNSWLAQVCEWATGIEEKEIKGVRMEIYPNPFINKTMVKYFVPYSSFVKLRMYDINGRLINILVNSERGGGVYSVVWDSKDLSGNLVRSGIYFCVFECNNLRITQKITVLNH